MAQDEIKNLTDRRVVIRHDALPLPTIPIQHVGPFNLRTQIGSCWAITFKARFRVVASNGNDGVWLPMTNFVEELIGPAKRR